MRLFETAANERGIGERGRKHCLFYATKSGTLTKLQYTLAIPRQRPMPPGAYARHEEGSPLLSARQQAGCSYTPHKAGPQTLHLRQGHWLS